MTLDSKDIALILISAIVGYLASVVANFTTSPISSFWEGRRSKSIERNKEKAFSEYAIIEKIHSGTIDKTIYFIQWHLILTVLVVSTTPGFIAGFAGSRASLTLALMELAMLYFSIFIGFYVVSSINRFNRWRTRLNNFEEYKATLEATFGSIEAPKRGRWPFRLTE